LNGGKEEPSVLLLSVPYALKAVDAGTLGGFPVSAFVLNTLPIVSATAANGATVSAPLAAPRPIPTVAAILDSEHTKDVWGESSGTAELQRCRILTTLPRSRTSRTPH